jgi:hypothetical protein
MSPPQRERRPRDRGAAHRSTLTIKVNREVTAKTEVEVRIEAAASLGTAALADRVDPHVAIAGIVRHLDHAALWLRAVPTT